MHLVLTWDVLEDERRALTRRELKRGVHVTVAHLDRRLCLERDPRAGALKEHPCSVALGAVSLAPEIEPRRAFELEPHPPADAQHAANQPVTVRSRKELTDRHEILDLPDSGGSQEARDQHVGVGQVQLLVLRLAIGGPERKVSAAVGVEQRGEHARRVKPRGAIPVDRSVRADQSHGVQVADHPVLGDRRVARRAHGSHNAGCHVRGGQPLENVVADAQGIGDRGEGRVDGTRGREEAGVDEYSLSRSCALQLMSSTERRGSVPNRTMPQLWAMPASGIRWLSTDQRGIVI